MSQVQLCFQHVERCDMELFYHERHMCIDNWHTLLPIEICKPTLLSDYLISIPFVFLDFNYKSNESGLKKKRLDFPEVCAHWSVQFISEVKGRTMNDHCSWCAPELYLLALSSQVKKHTSVHTMSLT